MGLMLGAFACGVAAGPEERPREYSVVLEAASAGAGVLVGWVGEPAAEGRTVGQAVRGVARAREEAAAAIQEVRKGQGSPEARPAKAAVR